MKSLIKINTDIVDRIKMSALPYKNQMLKQITNGRYGKKTYMDLVKKKTAQNKQPSKLFINKTYPLANEVLENFVEPKHSNKVNMEVDFATEIEPVKTNPIKFEMYANKNTVESLIERMDENTNNLIEPTDIKELKFASNKPVQSAKDEIMMAITKTIKSLNETAGPTPNKLKQNPKKDGDIQQKNNSIETMENKILELEDYVIEMAIEIENLKTNQNKIIRVINNLSERSMRSTCDLATRSGDLSITKNKMVR